MVNAKKIRRLMRENALQPKRRRASALDEAARLVIERIASSDALYHDTQHTALVTLPGAG